MALHEIRFAALAVACALLGPSAFGASRDAERGRLLAERNCSPCHAIGRSGDSPYAPAPLFRSLHERYDVEGLAEALVEGIVVGHKGPRTMPQFRLDPSEADDLIAYLKSLEPAAPKPGKSSRTPR